MAGSSMKDIKNRIKSVESTKQITKAMELAAVSKLRRAKERIAHSRPYFEILKQTIADIEPCAGDAKMPFYESRENGKACIIVIGGDRGLAGGYNNNILKLCAETAEKYRELSVLPIGRRMCEHFTKRHIEIVTDKYATAEDVGVGDCKEIASILCDEYQNEKFDALWICYTNFTSMMTQTVEAEKILPLEPGKNRKKMLTVCEPGAESVMQTIVPQYVSGIIYGAVCESRASEYASRQTAMNSANKNAEEMINDLTLSFNRARQAVITREITEIVAGAQ